VSTDGEKMELRYLDVQIRAAKVGLAGLVAAYVSTRGYDADHPDHLAVAVCWAGVAAVLYGVVKCAEVAWRRRVWRRMSAQVGAAVMDMQLTSRLAQHGLGEWAEYERARVTYHRLVADRVRRCAPTWGERREVKP